MEQALPQSELLIAELTKDGRLTGDDWKKIDFEIRRLKDQLRHSLPGAVDRAVHKMIVEKAASMLSRQIPARSQGRRRRSRNPSRPPRDGRIWGGR